MQIQVTSSRMTHRMPLKELHAKANGNSSQRELRCCAPSTKRPSTLNRINEGGDPVFPSARAPAHLERENGSRLVPLRRSCRRLNVAATEAVQSDDDNAVFAVPVKDWTPKKLRSRGRMGRVAVTSTPALHATGTSRESPMSLLFPVSPIVNMLRRIPASSLNCRPPVSVSTMTSSLGTDREEPASSCAEGDSPRSPSLTGHKVDHIFVSPPTRTYARTPRAFSDDSMVPHDGDPFGFLAIENPEPTMSSRSRLVNDAKDFEMSTILFPQLKERKKRNRTKRAAPNNRQLDANCKQIMERMIKEFEEIEQTELCIEVEAQPKLVTGLF